MRIFIWLITLSDIIYMANYEIVTFIIMRTFIWLITLSDIIQPLGILLTVVSLFLVLNLYPRMSDILDSGNRKWAKCLW